MRRTRYLALVAAAALVGTLGAPGASTGAAAAYTGPEITDLTLVAQSQGWTFAQAAAQYDLARAFGRIQGQVARGRPEMYAGAALSVTPTGPPTLYLSGRADDFVRDLVATAGFPIVLVEDRPYSSQELDAKAIRLAHELANLGFRYASTHFDESSGIVAADVTRTSTLPTTAEAVLALLPPDLRQGVRLLLTDEVVVVLHHAYGGMRARDDGVNECTTGWTVTDGFQTGVTTAAHCDGINEVVEPGAGTWALTHVDEHLGNWGDVEWKTSTHVEPDDFYATSTEIRDVADVELVSEITVNEFVCVYGRQSNSRDCNQRVLDGVTNAVVQGEVVSHLVAMDSGATTVQRDSGGGWSMVNTAFGSHVGKVQINGISRNVWSVCDLYDLALGVSVVS